jgi:hypothetical protein
LNFEKEDLKRPLQIFTVLKEVAFLNF